MRPAFLLTALTLLCLQAQAQAQAQPQAQTPDSEEQVDSVIDLAPAPDAEPPAEPSPAQELVEEIRELNPWTVNFFLENDLFANTDLSYTNGVRFSVTSPDVSELIELQGRTYPWVDKLNQALQFLHPAEGRQGMTRNLTVSLGQLMFTPEDRERRDLIVEDRPYAAWLYLGMGYHARSEQSLHSLEVNIGMVGPAALGKLAQDIVHDVKGVDKFKGWHNQLKNEPGIQMIFERKRRNELFGLDDGGSDGLQADFITHWGGALGNIGSFGNLGAELRLGFNLPADFGTSSLRPGGDISAPGLGGLNRGWRFYGFLAADARVVVNNIFLDGNYLRDSHGVDKELVVADMALGGVLVRERWRLSYAHVFRTKEFKQQRESQAYGGLSLTYIYNL